MGHERVGALPRTREWRVLIQQIAATAETPETVPALAAATLLKVRQRFDRIPADPGFPAALGSPSVWRRLRPVPRWWEMSRLLSISRRVEGADAILGRRAGGLARIR